MKRLLPLVLFVLYANLGFTQINFLNLEDPFINPEIYPEYLSKLKWRDSKSYTYVANNALVEVTIKNNKTDTILRLKNINDAIKPLKIDDLSSFPTYNWISPTAISFQSSERLIVYDFKRKNAGVLTKYYANAQGLDMDKSGTRFAYVLDGNVYISEKGNNYQVTNDGGNGIKNGEAVHRHEFGIEKGTFWSPNSNFLAFYRMDETMVTDYPLVDVSKRVAEAQFFKYPMAGMTSHKVQLGIYNNSTGETIFVKTGEDKDQFLTSITWGEDELSIYIAVVNRQQNHMQLNQYDAITGFFIKTIYEEKNTRYVEPQTPLYFLNSNSDEFLWLSRKDGWNHFYHFNRFGKLIGQLTRGLWEVTEYLGTDPKDEFLYFSASIDTPLEKHIYSYEFKTKEIKKLTEAPGQHKAYFSPDFKHFIDEYNSVDVPNAYELRTTAGNKVRDIFKSKNPFEKYTMGETSLFTIQNENKQDLYCRMVKPPFFDETKKYPVLIYVYGGPHSQLVKNSWNGAGFFLQYMAQKGYIIFTLDNRGTANRGFDFESVIHRNLGVNEVKDQMHGVEYLKSLPYVDANRIGLDGWSYGGFMTISLMLKHPEVFVSGTSGGPVIDWKWYEIMYGERYMDRIDENMQGYEETSLINQVENLQGNLLVIHGAMDPIVVWQHSLSFIEACIKAKKDVDYFVYPSHEHNVLGIDRVHLWKKIEKHHDRYLMGK